MNRVPVLARTGAPEFGEAAQVRFINSVQKTVRFVPTSDELAFRGRPVTAAIGRKGVVVAQHQVNEPGFGREAFISRRRIDSHHLGLSDDLNEIKFEAGKFACMQPCALGHDCVDAIALALLLKARGEVDRVTERGMVEMLVRAKVADATGTTAQTDSYSKLFRSIAVNCARILHLTLAHRKRCGRGPP